MELAVYNQQGQDTGRRVTLNDEVFRYRAQRARPLSSTLSNISPTSARAHTNLKSAVECERFYPQSSTSRKGGGGSLSVISTHRLFVGGGRVFRPRPRVTTASNSTRKLKELAAVRPQPQAAAGQIVVSKNPLRRLPKPKEFINFAKNLKVDGQKAPSRFVS